METYCHFCQYIEKCDIFEDETSRIAICKECYINFVEDFVEDVVEEKVRGEGEVQTKEV